MIESSRQEQISQPPPQRRGFLHAAWQWLVAPLTPAANPAGRRRRLLALLLPALFCVTIVVLLTVLASDAPGSLRRSVYLPLLFGLQALLLGSYLLNCAGHYKSAAGTAIAAVVFGPWGAVLLDPAILSGDSTPLAYTVVPVILCSILVSPLGTSILAGIELLALAILSA